MASQLYGSVAVQSSAAVHGTAEDIRLLSNTSRTSGYQRRFLPLRPEGYTTRYRSS